MNLRRCKSIFSLLLCLFFFTIVNSQSTFNVLKPRKNPHRFLAKIYFQNLVEEKYYILQVHEDSLEVSPFLKENKLKAPFARRNFPLPPPKISYSDIHSISISRRTSFGTGFLVGLVVGGVFGFEGGRVLACTFGGPSVSIGDKIGSGLLFASLIGAPTGLVGGLLGLLFRNQRTIKGKKNKFDDAKPLLRAYQHFK